MLCDMCAVVPLGVKCMNYEHFSQIHVHIQSFSERLRASTVRGRAVQSKS